MSTRDSDLSARPMPHKPAAKEPDNIRFAFSAKRIKENKKRNNVFGPPIGAIQVTATLYNTSKDTAYFLTSTCDGDQYQLHYDTTRFRLTQLIVCNTSFPDLGKIPPKGKHHFGAYFKGDATETKINLGFDFYSVSKSIDLNKVALHSIENRPAEEQTVIWAEEVPIN